MLKFDLPGGFWSHYWTLLGVYCFPALQLRTDIPCNYRVQNPLESNRICQQFKPTEAALAPVFK